MVIFDEQDWSLSDERRHGMTLETHSFKLELPRETTQAEAHQAGLNYIGQVLRLNHDADCRWTGSKPHSTMSG